MKSHHTMIQCIDQPKQLTGSSVESRSTDCQYKKDGTDVNKKRRKPSKELSYPYIDELQDSSLPGPSYYLSIEKVLSLIYTPKANDHQKRANNERLNLAPANVNTQSSNIEVTNTAINESFVSQSSNINNSISSRAKLEKTKKLLQLKTSQPSDLHQAINSPSVYDLSPQIPITLDIDHNDNTPSPQKRTTSNIVTTFPDNNTTPNMKADISPSKNQNIDRSNETDMTTSIYFEGINTPIKHRATCHKCGNMREYTFACTECPYIFCMKCVNKMKQEHGETVFTKGCPVCKNLCCCADKSENCHKIHHCYKKCPSTVNPNYVRPCILAQRSLQYKNLKIKDVSPITNKSPLPRSSPFSSTNINHKLLTTDSYGTNLSNNNLTNDYDSSCEGQIRI